MGRFPRKPKKPKANVQVYDPADARQYCESMVEHFSDHRAVLEQMANT